MNAAEKVNNYIKIGYKNNNYIIKFVIEIIFNIYVICKSIKEINNKNNI